MKGLNRFERFWRPVFGYAVSLTWVLHMLTVCYVVWVIILAPRKLLWL